MDYSAFKDNLNDLVRSKGISGHALAVELGVTPATVTRHLAGTRSPELDPVVRYAKYFHVSTDWLLGLTDERYESLSQEARDLIFLYSAASDDDKKVIQTILEKYRR